MSAEGLVYRPERTRPSPGIEVGPCRAERPQRSLALWACEKVPNAAVAQEFFRLRNVRDLREARQLEREDSPDLWLVGDGSGAWNLHAGVGALRKTGVSGRIAALCGDRPPGARLACLRAGADRALTAPYGKGMWQELHGLLETGGPPDPLTAWLVTGSLVGDVCHDVRNAAMGAVASLPGGLRSASGTAGNGQHSVRGLAERVWQESARLECLTRLGRLRFERIPPEELAREAAKRITDALGAKAVSAARPPDPLPDVWADRRAVVDCLADMALELRGLEPGEESRSVTIASLREGGGVCLEVRARPGRSRGETPLPKLGRWSTQPSWLAHVKLCAAMHGAQVLTADSAPEDRLRWVFP